MSSPIPYYKLTANDWHSVLMGAHQELMRNPGNAEALQDVRDANAALSEYDKQGGAGLFTDPVNALKGTSSDLASVGEGAMSGLKGLPRGLAQLLGHALSGNYNATGQDVVGGLAQFGKNVASPGYLAMRELAGEDVGSEERDRLLRAGGSAGANIAAMEAPGMALRGVQASIARSIGPTGGMGGGGVSGTVPEPPTSPPPAGLPPVEPNPVTIGAGSGKMPTSPTSPFGDDVQLPKGGPTVPGYQNPLSQLDESIKRLREENGPEEPPPPAPHYENIPKAGTKGYNQALVDLLRSMQRLSPDEPVDPQYEDIPGTGGKGKTAMGPENLRKMTPADIAFSKMRTGESGSISPEMAMLIATLGLSRLAPKNIAALSSVLGKIPGSIASDATATGVGYRGLLGIGNVQQRNEQQ